ncbi:MAG TPA: hypothetical protein VL860_09490 [Planctomycetota bacterium]|nr:hypothetical protein [Planctomycetota bacterium]
MPDPQDSTPPPTPAPTAAPAPTPPVPSPVTNQAPPSPGNFWLNLLIAVSFMAFAFSGYWLYTGYRDSRAAEARRKAAEADRHFQDGGLGEPELRAASEAAIGFLKQRPEYAAEVGELLDPAKPFDYQVQAVDGPGGASDLKFRMTIRGVKSSAWYDTVLRPAAGGRWELLSAQLTVPDIKAADGRKVIHLLDPAPVAAPSVP